MITVAGAGVISQQRHDGVFVIVED